MLAFIVPNEHKGIAAVWYPANSLRVFEMQHTQYDGLPRPSIPSGRIGNLISTEQS